MCVLMDGTQADIPENAELLSYNKISRVYYVQRDYPLIIKRSIPYLTNNEVWSLVQMNGEFAPLLVEKLDKYTVVMRYVKKEKITSRFKFRQNCRKALDMMNKRGIQHGDLTPPHVIPVGNSPVIIDWAESRVLTDRRGLKRPEGDSELLFRSMNTLLEENGLETYSREEW